MTSIEIHGRRIRAALSGFYAAAGLAHLAFPQPFLTITPDWVPYAPLVIFVTGLCELAGALGLWLCSMRRYAAIGLALYAVCVFPANIKHAVDALGASSASILEWTYHLIRLSLQPLIFWLALFAGEVTAWPFNRKKS
ncbi:hypothetical protein ASE04_29575 [Rhizobium sp. Root708]|uniref:DoxX family protein n=1 Tax=Rhizobium sp. Root708 TaxID=1736592 RepID=UPI0006F69323|nr:DoxX family protein [Rhizobium sp. Root708]KRB53447.1 hypothetical protein ASE04_29575 [Rhizobium sp. Root708]